MMVGERGAFGRRVIVVGNEEMGCVGGRVGGWAGVHGLYILVTCVVNVDK